MVEENWYFSFSYAVKHCSSCFSLFTICTSFDTKCLIAGNIRAKFFPVLGRVHYLKIKCNFIHRPQCIQNHLRAMENKLWLWRDKTSSAFLAKSLMTGYHVLCIFAVHLPWRDRMSFGIFGKVINFSSALNVLCCYICITVFFSHGRLLEMH